MIQRTVLFEAHKQLQAKIFKFSGWEMPLDYGSQLAEHLAVRRSAGLFDVSHMGVIDIKGVQAKQFLSRILANDPGKMQQPGSALYSCILDSDGKIIDDLIVYYLSADFYRLVVNAACKAKDLAWLQKNCSEPELSIIIRQDLAILAVQGPAAVEKSCQAFKPELATHIKALKKFSCYYADEYLIARTGYTGEDGLEIILPNTKALQLWQSLCALGIKPAGLGARDSLRLEAGLKLYGQDMDQTVNPFEADLSWTVAFEPTQRDFIGRGALIAQEPKLRSKLISVYLNDKVVLRHGQKVYNYLSEVGMITSGVYSPSQNRSIGFARVTLPLADKYFVEIRGIKHELVIKGG